MTDEKNKQNNKDNLDEKSADEQDLEFEQDSVLEYEDESLAKDKIKKLREKLKKCEEEKREYLDGWQRMKADALNERKRLQEEISKAREKGKIDALEAIVPVLDSFEQAFKGDAWEKLDDVWRQGIEFIHKQFENSLEEIGVESFAAQGDEFDPKLHEAVKEVETDDESKDHKIAKVLRKGYKIKDTIIRPAQVEVWVKK